MSVEDCERMLRATAEFVDPVMGAAGFRFQLDQAGHAHQDFASGFFVRENVRIGLIYRVRDRLGAVIYENDTTNVLHDDLMSWLGLAAKQQLRFVGSSMQSVAIDGGDAVAALYADLETLSPVLRDEESCSHAITEARRQANRAAHAR
jgi:hypothetical protein